MRDGFLALYVDRIETTPDKRLSPLARRALGHAAAHHGEMLWLAAFAADAGANPVDALAAVEELVSTVAVHEAPGNIGRVQWLAKDVTRALDPGTGATAGVVVRLGPWTEEAPSVAAELGVRPYDHAAAARWWGRADGEDAR